MAITNFETVNIVRSNNLLGDTWTWSNRHVEKVENVSKNISLAVKNGSLWVALTNSPTPEMRIYTGEHPCMTMVMFTYFEGALEECIREKRNL